MPLDHLRAVAQHNQRGDGAEAAGPQVNGRPVVYFAIYHRVNETHDLRGKLGHGSRWLRVVLRPVIPHPEVRGGFVEVRHEVFLIFVFVLQLLFVVGLVGS